MFGIFKRKETKYGIVEMVKIYESMSQAYMLSLKAIEDYDNETLVEQHLKQADELMTTAELILERYIEDQCGM